ncbi:MAG TPA: zf-HC2 domain-containing protein [Armatimonadota bacterium]|nr:zf-HC2 domain-containing protein [Armatimonadota bacterium]
MRCKLVRDNLPHYSLGVVDDATRAAMAEHLAGCERCRAEQAAFERLDAMLEPARPMTPDRDLWPGVAERLGPRRVWLPDWVFAHWQPAVAAATVMLALTVGGLVLHGRSPVVAPGSEMLASTWQEQQVVAEWSQPLADDAALGLIYASLQPEEAKAE